MAESCENDFLYPMKADIFYPIIHQNGYSQIVKEWVFDRTVVCNAEKFGSKRTQDITPDVYLQLNGLLLARTKGDLRSSSEDAHISVMNILVSNIRDRNDNLIYLESSGPRVGLGTIYEVSSLDPIVSPLGNIEYFHMVWRRTESQDVSF
jgi:hypothetical protein